MSALAENYLLIVAGLNLGIAVPNAILGNWRVAAFNAFAAAFVMFAWSAL